DSYVCAYLLKIQNYEVFAVTILPEADVFGNQQDKILSCHLNESKLKQVQEFCQQLKIPHHTVKGKGEFREEVLEQWIAAKVTGSVSNACWACHDLRLRLLYLKSVELGAKFLAT